MQTQLDYNSLPLPWCILYTNVDRVGTGVRKEVNKSKANIFEMYPNKLSRFRAI
jgi:hypothetical protein